MSVPVLVLEDDQNMQELLVESLEDAGYFSQGASSADEALELAKKFKFDLVVSDVRMAGSTDGLGALEALKQRIPELRCIVITGYASEDAPQRAIRIQVDDYIYKPFRLPDLLAAVKRVLGSGQERSGYRNLLASVLAAPKKLMEKAEAAMREKATKSLDHHRDRAFQGFYVGIRSNLISRGAALDVWDRLERLEHGYETIANNPASTNEQYSAGAQHYQQLFELMTAMAQSQTLGTMKNREGWQVDRATFSRFYDRIQQGRITPEQLRVAIAVWRARPEVRSQKPELQKLFSLMWGKEDAA